MILPTLLFHGGHALGAHVSDLGAHVLFCGQSLVHDI